jgi:hypothetical protein
MGVVGDKSRIADVEIIEHSLATLLTALKNLVLPDCVVLAYADIQPLHIGVELTLRLEYNVFVASLRVPKGEAVGIVAVATILDQKGCGKLIAIAEVVEVVATFVDETATRCNLLMSAIVERVDVA